ncbi:MAG: AAA family ATPase [Cyclobacteriaceae bacterium]|nr:AAA family ATPase [Cyclobacteriaceae bacterium]
MLKKIVVDRFKSIQKADLSFSKLNFFIGTNASGKSNFFDALRVLQGIGHGFTIHEIFHGRAKTSSSIEWDGIRGGGDVAVFRAREGKPGRPSDPDTKNTFQFETTYLSNDVEFWYKIKIDPIKGLVACEEFSFKDTKSVWHNVFQTIDAKLTDRIIRVKIFQGGKGKAPHHSFNRHIPVLHQMQDLRPEEFPFEHRDVINQIINLLQDTQKLDLIPSVLREYSRQTQTERIGEHGENFAALVKSILSNDIKKPAYNGWLSKLTPNDLDEAIVKKGALGEPIFGVIEGRNEILAPQLSDGTLRFAALTAALFQSAAPHILLLEEVDNGIHPSRLRLLVELLLVRARKGQAQVFITTHSPILLSWLDSKIYESVFHCSRSHNGASNIQPVTDIPNFNELIKKQPFGDLFAEGWIENSL